MWCQKSSALNLAFMTLLTTSRPALALRSTLSALTLRSLVLLLSTRCRAAWALSACSSGVAATTFGVARLLLGLRPRLLCGLLSGLLAARLRIGTLLARSYAVRAWPLPGLVVAALSAPLLRLGAAIAAFRTLPLLLTTIGVLCSLPRLTATFSARA